MKKEVAQLTVYTDDAGRILIEQEDGLQEDSALVMIFPDQVDLLCQWLQEAKSSLSA